MNNKEVYSIDLKDNYLCLSTSGPGVEMYNLETSELIFKEEPFDSAICLVKFVDDNNLFVLTEMGEITLIRNYNSIKDLDYETVDFKSNVTESICIENKVLIGTQEGEIHVFDIKTMETTYFQQYHKAQVTQIELKNGDLVSLSDVSLVIDSFKNKIMTQKFKIPLETFSYIGNNIYALASGSKIFIFNNKKLLWEYSIENVHTMKNENNFLYAGGDFNFILVIDLKNYRTFKISVETTINEIRIIRNVLFFVSYEPIIGWLPTSNFNDIKYINLINEMDNIFDFVVNDKFIVIGGDNGHFVFDWEGKLID
ncbi:hypothetical protein A0H76_2806 [Hepatospora eriocheir]|uniref:Uncharacterized protein n=1 Tax=Hepatospora eriocheir TaxID=1081669 RepID=A0A1X0QJC7_9MICR|nr:hypothetical protein A0H76_2806 [Hepatospora eriocheir]